MKKCDPSPWFFPIGFFGILIGINISLLPFLLFDFEVVYSASDYLFAFIGGATVILIFAFFIMRHVWALFIVNVFFFLLGISWLLASPIFIIASILDSHAFYFITNLLMVFSALSLDTVVVWLLYHINKHLFIKFRKKVPVYKWSDFQRVKVFGLLLALSGIFGSLFSFAFLVDSYGLNKALSFQIFSVYNAILPHFGIILNGFSGAGFWNFLYFILSVFFLWIFIRAKIQKPLFLNWLKRHLFLFCLVIIIVFSCSIYLNFYSLFSKNYISSLFHAYQISFFIYIVSVHIFLAFAYCLVFTKLLKEID